jgi:hypothetical protein
MEPFAIALGSGQIIAADGTIQALEQGIKQKPLAPVIFQGWSLNLWHEWSHRPFVDDASQ